MSRITPLVEVHQLKQRPETGDLTELVSGEIVEREVAGPAHDRIVARLAEALSAHIDDGDLGAVFRSPWPVELSKFDLVRPDVYFVAWKDGVMGVDGVTGTPELVIEVTTPESRERDLGEKKRLYSWAGVFEYWVVDPESRTVQPMTKATQGYKPIAIEGSRLQSLLLPDFELDLDWLFSGVK